MENEESTEVKTMDFESGIDTWVIDKEDSNGSCSLFDKVRKDIDESIVMKTFDKENIKQCKNSSFDKKSLRCIRIPKHNSYKDISSDPGKGTRKKLDESDDYFNWNKKLKFDSAQSQFNIKGVSRVQYASSSSLNSLIDFRVDKESLSSEEISSMLSEIEGSSDSIQDKSREKLLSIENVSSLIDKHRSEENLSMSRNPELKCSVCSNEFSNLEEFSTHEIIHSPSVSKIKPQHPHDKTLGKVKNNLNVNGSVLDRTDFLDTYKNHFGLTNRRSGPLTVTNSLSDFCNDLKINCKEIISSTTMKKKPFKCKLCNYCSKELFTFKSHQILWHSVLECEYCDFKTSQCADLCAHIRVHFQLDCPLCDFQCPSENGLRNHLTTEHPGKKRFICKKCVYTSTTLIKYIKHAQLHTVMGELQCKACNELFTSKQTLKLHLLEHGQEKNILKCDSCESQFSSKRFLKLHKKIHKATPIFICDSCNTKFTNKNSLKLHVKIHSHVEPKTPFKCEKCSSVFSQKNYLKLHMRVHFPKCKYCHSEFSDPCNLLKHNCINKLYNVQKRSLNFEEGNSINEKTSINNEKEHFKSESKHSIENKRRNEESIPKHNSSATYTKESNKNVFGNNIDNLLFKKKKQRKNRTKLLALRQNLPSRKSQRFIENLPESKNNKLSINKKISNKIKKAKEKTKTRRNMGCSVKGIGAFIPVSSYDQCSPFGNKFHMIKKQNKQVKKNKKEPLTGNLHVEKILFHEKPSLPLLVIDPVSFVNNTFVQCYYTSQQPVSIQDNHTEHHIRNLRNNNLLSCCFCNYKTNSALLLQKHKEKNHTWGSAVVNTLFG